MRCLVITAHPLPESLCGMLSQSAIAFLKSGGHDVVRQDLYQDRFEPALTALERQSYYGQAYDTAAIARETRQLLEAEAVILVFPTWWFGFPAMLKGWFDRVWAPGIAYDHSPDLGPIKPRLKNLKKFLAITTLGAPWWVDILIMRRPLKRILKTAILHTCAPGCKFKMLSLYKSENPDPAAVNGLVQKINAIIGDW